jgi:hypothetical protein
MMPAPRVAPNRDGFACWCLCFVSASRFLSSCNVTVSTPTSTRNIRIQCDVRVAR